MASEVNKSEENNEYVSFQKIKIKSLYIILGVIWSLVLTFSVAIAVNFYELATINKLDKILVSFIAGIFIASLIFTDSVLKTFKYNVRPKETIINSVFQTIALVAISAWAYFQR